MSVLFSMLAQLTLICSARSDEAEEVGQRTERDFLPGFDFLDCRVAARLGGVRGVMARTTHTFFILGAFPVSSSLD